MTLYQRRVVLVSDSAGHGSTSHQRGRGRAAEEFEAASRLQTKPRLQWSRAPPGAETGRVPDQSPIREEPAGNVVGRATITIAHSDRQILVRFGTSSRHESRPLVQERANSSMKSRPMSSRSRLSGHARSRPRRRHRCHSCGAFAMPVRRETQASKSVTGEGEYNAAISRIVDEGGRPVDGHEERMLAEPVSDVTGSNWSPDGRTLFYSRVSPSTRTDVWMSSASPSCFSFARSRSGRNAHPAPADRLRDGGRTRRSAGPSPAR